MKTMTSVIISFLILHTSHSYILLTANMEDVQALAKQLAASSVIDQVGKIWRRAAFQFKNEVNKDLRRNADESDDSNQEPENEDLQRTRRIVKDLIAIGKHNGLLGPIKRAFDLLDPLGNVS